MSVREVANVLGVTPTTIFRLIQLNQLPATQACANAPWILYRQEWRNTGTETTERHPHHRLIHPICSLIFNDIRRSASCRILEEQFNLPSAFVESAD
jgi:hypothetical protein